MNTTIIPYAQKVQFIRTLYADTHISELLGGVPIRTVILHDRCAAQIDEVFAEALSRYDEFMAVPFETRAYDFVAALNKEYRPTQIGRLLGISDSTVKRILKKKSARITYPLFKKIEYVYHHIALAPANWVPYTPQQFEDDPELLKKLRPVRKIKDIKNHEQYKNYGEDVYTKLPELLQSLAAHQSISSIARDIGISNSYLRECSRGLYSEESTNAVYNLLKITHS